MIHTSLLSCPYCKSTHLDYGRFAAVRAKTQNDEELGTHQLAGNQIAQSQSYGDVVTCLSCGGRFTRDE